MGEFAKAKLVSFLTKLRIPYTNFVQAPIAQTLVLKLYLLVIGDKLTSTVYAKTSSANSMPSMILNRKFPTPITLKTYCNCRDVCVFCVHFACILSLPVSAFFDLYHYIYYCPINKDKDKGKTIQDKKTKTR